MKRCLGCLNRVFSVIMGMKFLFLFNTLAVAKIVAQQVVKHASPYKTMTKSVVALFLKSADSREKACRFDSGSGTID